VATKKPGWLARLFGRARPQREPVSEPHATPAAPPSATGPAADAALDQAIADHERQLAHEGRQDQAGPLAILYMQKAVRVRESDHRAALPLYDRALALFERLARETNAPEHLHYLSHAYRDKALSLTRLGDLQGALALYDRVIALAEQRAEEPMAAEALVVMPEGVGLHRPQPRKLVGELALAYVNKAAVTAALGDPATAMQLCDRGLSLLRQCVQLEQQHDLAGDLGSAYVLKADLLSQPGDAQEAIALRDQAVALLEPLVAGEGRQDLAPELARCYLARATRLYASGAVREAVAVLDRGLRLLEQLVYQTGRKDLAPRLAEACANKGIALSDLGEHQAALALYEQSLRLAPDRVLTYLNRGLAHYRVRHYQAALADYNRGLQLHPEPAVAANFHNNRGWLYQGLERPDEALADYSQAIALDPRNGVAYANRAAAYASRERYEEALADSNQALALAPTAVGHATRAGIYIKLGRIKEALADLGTALEMDPQCAPAHANLGLLLSGAGRLREALPHLDRAARLGLGEMAEEALQVRRQLLEAARQDGSLEAAEGAFWDAVSLEEMRRAVDRFPFLNLAEFLEPLEAPHKGRVQAIGQRLAWLRQIADEDAAGEGAPAAPPPTQGPQPAPDDLTQEMIRYADAGDADNLWAFAVKHRSAGAFALLGNLYHDRHDFARAIEANRQAHELEPANPHYRFNLGMAYHNRGYVLLTEDQLDEALPALRAALGYIPEYAPVHTHLGVLYYRQGREADALEAYRTAVRTDPGEYAAWLNLASCLSHQGQVAEACAAYEGFLRHCPASDPQVQAFRPLAETYLKEHGRPVPGL
jgi:tetratricopeptide (TPR) repeat protein